MGGTFMSLPTDYRDYFVRNLHDALSGHSSKDVGEAVRWGCLDAASGPAWMLQVGLAWMLQAGLHECCRDGCSWACACELKGCCLRSSTSSPSMPCCPSCTWSPPPLPTTLCRMCRYSEQSRTKCIGMTIETRPDFCLTPHLSQMLSYGCTRLEIGLQVRGGVGWGRPCMSRSCVYL